MTHREMHKTLSKLGLPSIPRISRDETC